MRLIHFLSASLALVCALPAQENLELGKMWTFENPPLAYLEKEYGFKPTQEWLDSLRLASIKFGGGCSSSFVSPKGLIMTNHHCARGDIAKASGEEDWLNNGFYAKAMEDEVKLHGLTVQQLVSMEDVTERMNYGVEPTDNDDTISQKRAQNERKILESVRKEGTNPQVVKLFQGAVFQLYVYKIYDDIRLVCAPHLQTAHFGGDPDNFTYPRYGIDFTFCRAYENDKPVDTSAHYFKWCTGQILENDLVFVTGNPGTTKRLLTYAQLEYMRDVWHPIVNQLIDNRLATRKNLAKKHPELKKDLQTEILSFENAQKAYTGYLAGLKDDSLMAQKRQAEQAFQRRVEADEKAKEKFGGTWRRIEEVTSVRAQFEPKRRFQTTGGHPVLAVAMRVLRGDKERAMSSAGGEISKLQRADFVDHVTRARQWLSKEDAKCFGDLEPEALASALESSKLNDPAYIRELFDGGDDAIQNNDDVALVMARGLRPLMQTNAAIDEELTAVEEAQGARVGQALHAVYGNKVSPDATLTLRFSDGIVSGYPFNGTKAPFRTTFYGLYARAHEFDNKYPFDLPQIWLDRKDKVDMSRAVDLVSTNDIIGGNSGSPLVNKDLEVVGLVFDGNIEMLPNRYLYRGDIPRSVSVHVDAIMESLKKIYDADRIVQELTSSSQ